MTLNFKVKNPDQKESILFIEFKRNGEHFKFYPGKRIEVANWSVSKQVCLSNHKHHKELNAYLKVWREDLEKTVHELEAKKARLTKELIQQQLDRTFNVEKLEKHTDGQITDFISFMDLHISSQVGKARGTVQILKQCRKNVIFAFDLLTRKNQVAYLAMSNKEKSATELKPDYKLQFDMINLKFMQDFQNYMYKAKFSTSKNGIEIKQNYKKNYIAKQIKILKQFVDAATDHKLIERFTSKSIKVEYEDVDSVYLNFQEMQALFDLDLSEDKTEDLVRDMFLFNCFFGLRFSDLSSLTKESFKTESIKGRKHLVYSARAKKTDKKVVFPVHQNAIAILNKYDGQFPSISEGEFNKTIKMIGLKAGLTSLEVQRETRGETKIQKQSEKYLLLTTHAGRRSFCTNYYIKGVAIQAIMRVSGHASEKQFMTYVHKDATVDIDILAEQLAQIPIFKKAS